MADQHTGDDKQSLHRLLFFSDAVFAIVLTLLVLEIRPPEVENQALLWGALVEMAPHFIAFLSSFGLISIFWVAHMAITRKLIAFDWLVACLNLVFLLAIAFMPFVSGLIGEYGVNGDSWRLYCGAMIAATLAQIALLLAIVRDKGRLIGGIDGRELRYRLARAASPGVIFGAGLAVSLAGAEEVAAFCWVLFAPVLILVQVFLAPKKAVVSEGE